MCILTICVHHTQNTKRLLFGSVLNGADFSIPTPIDPELIDFESDQTPIRSLAEWSENSETSKGFDKSAKSNSKFFYL